MGLFVWFLMGRWIERLHVHESFDSGLLALGGAAAVIWAVGWSAAGFVLLLILFCTWLFTKRPRKAQTA